MLALLWCGIGLCVIGCGGAVAVTIYVYRKTEDEENHLSHAERGERGHQTRHGILQRQERGLPPCAGDEVCVMCYWWGVDIVIDKNPAGGWPGLCRYVSKAWTRLLGRVHSLAEEVAHLGHPTID